MKIMQLVLTSFVIGIAKGDRFGYFQNFEKVWEKSSPACAGKNQSPIHIKTQNATELSIPALELDGYQNLLPTPISISNNGHSVELRPKKGEVSDNTPQIFGGVLLNRYHLDSFHFHWGSKNSQGSEHVIDNVRYPMELHIIHRNEKYNNLSEAVSYRDGLAVLAFFLETRERNNPALDPILNELSEVVEENSSVEMRTTFPLSNLLPQATDIFYAYKGSLTTPPCSEVVTWIVFPDPVTISFDQIDKFRTLASMETNNEKHLLEDNFRHLEPLNGRRIYVKRRPAFSSSFKDLNFTAINMTDLMYLGPSIELILRDIRSGSDNSQTPNTMGRQERRERRRLRREEEKKKEEEEGLGKVVIKHVVKSILMPHHAVPTAIHMMENIKLGKKVASTVGNFVKEHNSTENSASIPNNEFGPQHGTPEYTPSAPPLLS